MKHLTPLALLVFLALVPACSSGGGGGGSSSNGSAALQLAVGSAGESDLFSLSGELSELRLVDERGGTTDNLMDVPMVVELVGLESTARLVAEADVDPGAYVSMEVAFTEGSLCALDRFGNEVRVRPGSDSFEAPLMGTWDADEGDGQELFLEIDLSGSVGPMVGNGVDFDGDAVVERVVPRPIESVQGTVLEASAFDRLVRMEAFVAAGGDEVPLGELDVRITNDTLLLDVDGTPFPTPDSFFASLRPGMTMLETNGTLTGFGELTAAVARITDQAGGPAPALVVIEGMVLHVDVRDRFFVLLIREIEEGEDIARPVLQQLGDPSSIDVFWDDDTRFSRFGGDDSGSDEMIVGRVVRVGFQEFDEPPFLADTVILDDRHDHTCVRGEVVSVRGLPDRVIIEIDDDDVHWWMGDIEEEEITVELDGAKVFLNIRGEPRLQPDRLLNGLKVKVCGQLGGTRDAPVFDADEVSVKPGYLIKGEVSSTVPARDRYELSSAKIVQTFGEPVTGAPLSVVNAPRADFMQDADSASEFFRLFDDLERDETLDVKIKGLGTGVAEEVEAFEVKSKVRHARGGGGGDDDDDEGDEDDDGFDEDDDGFDEDDDGGDEDDDGGDEDDDG